MIKKRNKTTHRRGRMSQRNTPSKVEPEGQQVRQPAEIAFQNADIESCRAALISGKVVRIGRSSERLLQLQSHSDENRLGDVILCSKAAIEAEIDIHIDIIIVDDHIVPFAIVAGIEGPCCQMDGFRPVLPAELHLTADASSGT